MSLKVKRAKDVVDKDMQGYDAHLAMVPGNTLTYIVMWTINALDAAGMLMPDAACICLECCNRAGGHENDRLQEYCHECALTRCDAYTHGWDGFSY